MTKLRCMLCCLMICTITIDARTVNDIYKRISAQVSLKVPGNQSRNYSLAFQGAVDDKGIYLLESEEKIPLIITERIERDNVKCVMVVSITALEDVYFNYQQQLKTGFRHNDCMFYLPGFWYSRNLRSPKGAPSFHISESWLVREDRLSSPLTGIFNQKDGRYMTVARKDDFQWDALATHQTGEIILSGKTSLGFTGFESHDGTSTLSFGFPYREAPKTYIRKLTLAPEVTSFQYLKKGETYHPRAVGDLRYRRAKRDFRSRIGNPQCGKGCGWDGQREHGKQRIIRTFCRTAGGHGPDARSHAGRHAVDCRAGPCGQGDAESRI